MIIRIAITILIGCSMVIAGEEWRLPGTLRPSSYNIRLTPHLDVDDFITYGSIEILVDCITDTDVIILNSAEVTMDQSSIKVIEILFSHDLILSLTLLFAYCSYSIENV